MAIQPTLQKVSRIYDLVEEMRGIVGELREVGVEVRIRAGDHFGADPLSSFAALTITLRPGCEADR